MSVPRDITNTQLNGEMPWMSENYPINMSLILVAYTKRIYLGSHHFLQIYDYPHVSSLNHVLPMCLKVGFARYKSGLLHIQTNNDKPL